MEAPELLNELLPPPRVQEVLVGLEEGVEGEGQEAHALLHYVQVPLTH